MSSLSSENYSPQLSYALSEGLDATSSPKIATKSSWNSNLPKQAQIDSHNPDLIDPPQR